MPPWNRLLLGLYYHASLPLRTLVNRRADRRGEAPIMVLFYHRVAGDRANAWTCSFDVFARQMAWLRERFDMVSLAEAQNRIRQGSNHRPAIAVTFDDGYFANCRRAIPLLIGANIPCTYFVATRFVFEQTPFPHDVAQGRPLRPNTPEQVRQMAAAGIEIGAHTRTHADLGRIEDVERLEDEIIGSRDELAELIERPIRYFAFPYGQHWNLQPAAFQIAHDAGFEGVCSAYGGYNFPGDDAFHVQRIHGDEESIRLKNWLTVDPRKRRTSRFTYRLERSPQPLAGAVT